MPGVEAVYTGADLIKDDIGTIPTLSIFKRPDGKPMTVPPRRLLAHEVVRFAGEAVAAVVATSRVLAQTAAEAIEIEYEILPSVVDPVEAIKPGAPVVWPDAPDNIVAAMSYGDAAKVEEAFAKAAHTVSLDLVSQRLIPSAMEPRSTIAEIDKKTGRLILHVQSQTPGSTRDVLAEAILKRPKESVRVLVGDIGGGFGQKTNLYPEDGVVAYAATKLGRKIRWRGDRTDEFVGGTHGRDLTSTGEFALDAKGRVLAYRVRSVGGTGAYSTGAGNIIPLVLGPFVQTGVYDLPLVHFEVKSVMTNTAPVGAYRGAGRPEAVFIVERSLHRVGQLRLEVRDGLPAGVRADAGGVQAEDGVRGVAGVGRTEGDHVTAVGGDLPCQPSGAVRGAGLGRDGGGCRRGLPGGQDGATARDALVRATPARRRAGDGAGLSTRVPFRWGPTASAWGRLRCSEEVTLFPAPARSPRLPLGAHPRAGIPTRPRTWACGCGSVPDSDRLPLLADVQGGR